MIRRYRVAIIGCGNIALAGHLPAVLAHPRFELAGLCDLRAERLALARQACGREVPVASDYRSLITDHSFDACILALHPEHSVPIAMDLLQRGIAVLGEKPLAISLEDGERLAKTVESTRGIYQIGFVMRYCTLMRDVAKWIAPFASPRLYQVSIYDEQLDRCTPEYFAIIQGILRHSSAITHEGSHVIDWMSLFNPSPIRAVKASALKTRADLAGPNLWACNLDYADGSTLQLNIGWLLTNQPPSTLRVVGGGGWLELDLFRGEGQLAVGPRVAPIRTEPLRQAWKEQLDLFAEALDRGTVTGANVYDGLRALRATLACEQSFRRDFTREMT